MAGRPLPAPPPLDTPLANAAAYRGTMRPGGAFEIRPGNPLTIVANGRSAALQPWGGDAFRTTHPSFRAFSLMFEREGNAVIRARIGVQRAIAAGSGAQLPASDPALASLPAATSTTARGSACCEWLSAGGSLARNRNADDARSATTCGASASRAGRPSAASFARLHRGRPADLHLVR